MLKVFKWYLVDANEIEETLFQHDAVVEALEKQVSQLKIMLENLRKESVTIHQQMLEAETAAAQVPGLTSLVKELEAENIVLQKAAFTPLPVATPVKNKGGRPKKTNGTGPVKEN